MPMPSAWVDRIFARMLIRYGADWIRKWEGVPEDAVKADWADSLDGIERNPDRIRYALDNLPERPPTVTEFRAACNRFSAPDPARLMGPKPTQEDVERFRAATAGIGSHKADPLAWARNLRHAELFNGGELPYGRKLTIFQRQCWRDVLHEDGTQRVQVFA